MTFLVALVIAWLALDVMLVGLILVAEAVSEGRRFVALGAAVVVLGAAVVGYLGMLAVLA